MTPKTFVGLAVVTAVVTAAAITGAYSHYSVGGAVRTETPAFPGLVDKLDEVTQVTIQAHDKTFILKRDRKGWVMADKGGYVARGKKVNKTLVQLSQLRLTEEKTRKPDLFPRLQVEDVTADKAKSKVVTLKSTSDATLATMIVGKRKMVANIGDSIYLRRPGENQAWLARGSLVVSEDTTDWLVRDIVDIPTKTVKNIIAIQADGSQLSVTRIGDMGSDLAVDNLPEGVKLGKEAKSAMNSMASALSVLDLDDVAPAGGFDFTGKDVIKAKVRTFAGVIIDVAMVKKDDKAWVTFTASAAPGAPTPAPVKGGNAPKSASQEAAAINARVTGWAYQIPSYKAEGFEQKLADVLEKKDEKS